MHPEIWHGIGAAGWGAQRLWSVGQNLQLCVHYRSALRLALAQRSVPAKSVVVVVVLKPNSAQIRLVLSDSRNNNNKQDHIEFGVLWKHQAKRKALKVSDFKVLKMKKCLTVKLTSCGVRELDYTVVTIM